MDEMSDGYVPIDLLSLNSCSRLLLTEGMARMIFDAVMGERMNGDVDVVSRRSARRSRLIKFQPLFVSFARLAVQ